MAKNLYFCQLRDFLVSKSKSLIYPASSLIFNINKYEDFKSAQYQSPAPFPIVCHFPANKVVPNPVLTSFKIHPFISACSAFLNSEASSPFLCLKRELDCFYKSYKPTSACVFSGLAKHIILDHEIAPYFLFPWANSSFACWVNHIDSVCIRESSAVGSPLTINHGWTWSGPVSDQKLHIESLRLSNILESISNNGYRRDLSNSGDILATLMIDGNHVRCLILTGQHRLFALLSWVTIIFLRIINTVTRSDFPYWPNVQRKFYSEEDSLLIFDHYFKSPPLIT